MFNCAILSSSTGECGDTIIARSLDQIISELDTSYNPQKTAVQTQIDALPGQEQSQEAGLSATKDQSFNDITNAARERGMGFSGIPLGEQASYLGSTYLPAIANLKSTFAQKGSDLASTLNNIGLDENKYAQTIRQAELDRDESARQFDAQQAAAAQARADAARAAAGSGADYSGLFGSGGDSSAPTNAPADNSGARAFKQSNGYFAFTAPNGQAVNALQYSQISGTPLRNLLSWMAGQGDSGAKAALGFIGNDGNADPTKITNQALANLYKSLTGRNVGIYKAPAPIKQVAPKSLSLSLR